MGPGRRPDPADSSGRASFGTTHGSLILAARARDTPEARQTLATLCEIDGYPLSALAPQGLRSWPGPLRTPLHRPAGGMAT